VSPFSLILQKGKSSPPFLSSPFSFFFRGRCLAHSASSRFPCPRPRRITLLYLFPRSVDQRHRMGLSFRYRFFPFPFFFFSCQPREMRDLNPSLLHQVIGDADAKRQPSPAVPSFLFPLSLLPGDTDGGKDSPLHLSFSSNHQEEVLYSCLTLYFFPSPPIH